MQPFGVLIGPQTAEVQDSTRVSFLFDFHVFVYIMVVDILRNSAGKKGVGKGSLAPGARYSFFLCERLAWELLELDCLHLASGFPGSFFKRINTQFRRVADHEIFARKEALVDKEDESDFVEIPAVV